MPKAYKDGDILNINNHEIKLLKIYSKETPTSDRKIDIKCTSCHDVFTQPLKSLTKYKLTECTKCKPRNQKYKKGDLLGKSKLKMVSDKTYKLTKSGDPKAVFECPFCSRHFEMSVSYVLKSDKVISCGCQRKITKFYVNDYYGKNNEFKLLKKIKGKSHYKGLFECPKCQETFECNLSDIHNKSQDCGCSQRPQKGKVLGTKGFKVLEPYTKTQANHTYSLYECIFCKKPFEARDSFIRTDKQVSCGCNSFQSQAELDIKEYLVSIGINDIIVSDRKILNNKELDILLPKQNLAIEYNGLFWHNEERLGKKYHINKTNKCSEKGIDLIHINSYQWKYKQDIVKDLLKKRTSKVQNKVFARKCSLKEVPTSEAKEFINTNHIQGYSASSIKIGLYYNNELISIMTFGKSRFNKNYEYELVRFCNKLDYSVLGGASKILKYFEKTYLPNSLLSYCDISLFSGEVYEDLGFTLSHISEPNYFYFQQGTEEIFSRHKFQKHKLKSLDNYDETLTEYENMKNNKYLRYWDCGNKVYIKIYKKE